MLNLIIDDNNHIATYNYNIYNIIRGNDMNMMEISLQNISNNMPLLNRIKQEQKIDNLVLIIQNTTYLFETCYIDVDMYQDLMTGYINTTLKLYYDDNCICIPNIAQEISYKQIVRNNKLEKLLENELP